MVATMTVAVPAMMLVVVRSMVTIILAMMTVMAVMKQCAQRNKGYRRTHDIVTMVCAGRCTG